MTSRFLSREHLQSLHYNKIKAVVVLAPAMSSCRTTFKAKTEIRSGYAFAETGNGGFVPCFTAKHEVSRMVFANDVLYESIRVPRDFGTYENVPKVLADGVKNTFMRVPYNFPVYEGYFDSAWAADAALPELKTEILERLLPFERIKDADLENSIKSLSFVSAGGERDDEFDDFDETLEIGD